MFRDRARLDRIRNWQSTDWYAAIFMRPIAILVMLVIADWEWLSPNLLTTLANLSKLAAAALILTGDRAAVVAAVVLLQLGLLFDHLDGTVARYRQTGTAFGSFYDKISDAITWFPVTMAVGWIAYQRSGDALLLVAAAIGAYSLVASGYSKWIIAHEEDRLAWDEARADPAAAVAARTARRPPAPPPHRSAAQWLSWLGRSMLQILRFEEVDLFFWTGLFLLWDRHLDWLLWGMAATQTFAMLSIVVRRALRVRAIDRIRAADPARAADLTPAHTNDTQSR